MNSISSEDLEMFDVYGIKPEDDEVFESSEESEISDDEVEEDDEHTNIRMPQSITSKRNVTFNQEIFSGLIPEKTYLASVFNSDKSMYQEFFKNAFLWDEFFELCKYKLFTLADFIHNEYFYKMIEIHDRLYATGSSVEGILPVLSELMERKFHFIIPFVYIANYVPKQFEKMNLSTFGVSDKYPELIKKAKVEIESNKKVMRPVKDILRTYHIFYESSI